MKESKGTVTMTIEAYDSLRVYITKLEEAVRVKKGYNGKYYEVYFDIKLLWSIIVERYSKLDTVGFELRDVDSLYSPSCTIAALPPEPEPVEEGPIL